MINGLVVVDSVVVSVVDSVVVSVVDPTVDSVVSVVESVPGSTVLGPPVELAVGARVVELPEEGLVVPVVASVSEVVPAPLQAQTRAERAVKKNEKCVYILISIQVPCKNRKAPATARGYQKLRRIRFVGACTTAR